MSEVRQRRAPRARSGWWLGLWAAAVAASCFDGADAQGLPCRTDEDCGVDQACAEGFCGGPPATSSAGSSSGSSTTAADSSTGPVAMCGNGIVEADNDEQCDPGSNSETAECNADCTVAACGDGLINAAAGEECDDQNSSALDECTSDCRLTLFWDDLSSDPLGPDGWETRIPIHEDNRESFMLDSGWRWNVPEPGAWHSGVYSETSGTARLITPSITFPDDPGDGFQWELRFRHRLRFDGNRLDVGDTRCPQAANGDGGVVMISTGPGPAEPAGPPMGHPETLDDEGGCVGLPVPANPLFDPMMPNRPVYTGNTGPNYVDVVLPLSGVAGQTVQVVFEIGYDCDNCWQDGAPTNAGWTIDDVVVAPFATDG